MKKFWDPSSFSSVCRAGGTLFCLPVLVLTACWADFPESLLKSPNSAAGKDARGVGSGDFRLHARVDYLGIPHDGFNPHRDVRSGSCQPNTFLRCADRHLLIHCNSRGTGTTATDCRPFQCDAKNKKCTDCIQGYPSQCKNGNERRCNASGYWETIACKSGCDTATGTCCEDRDKDGVSTCDNDCNDDPDKRGRYVYPGQIEFFDESADDSFDYDCNNKEELELLDLLNCIEVDGTCTGNGWIGSVPYCGVLAAYGVCDSPIGHGRCNFKRTNKTQRCR